MFGLDDCKKRLQICKVVDQHQSGTRNEHATQTTEPERMAQRQRKRLDIA